MRKNHQHCVEKSQCEEKKHISVRNINDNILEKTVFNVNSAESMVPTSGVLI